MRRFCMLVGLLSVALFMTSNSFALEIQVAPQTLVLSSAGGNLTVHTDFPFAEVDENLPVSLAVNGQDIPVRLFADCQGNLVAQCTKEAVEGAIGEFDGKFTTATVRLDVDDDYAEEDITVKK